jgi:hypothetical protein
VGNDIVAVIAFCVRCGRVLCAPAQGWSVLRFADQPSP